MYGHVQNIVYLLVIPSSVCKTNMRVCIRNLFLIFRLFGFFVRNMLGGVVSKVQKPMLAISSKIILSKICFSDRMVSFGGLCRESFFNNRELSISCIDLLHVFLSLHLVFHIEKAKSYNKHIILTMTAFRDAPSPPSSSLDPYLSHTVQ